MPITLTLTIISLYKCGKYACVWNLENWYARSYWQNRHWHTDAENKCVGTQGVGVGGTGRLQLTCVFY